MLTDSDSEGAETSVAPSRTFKFAAETGVSADADGRAFLRGSMLALLAVTPFWTLVAILVLAR